MRPIRVELQAFGPFPGKQVVDFRDLGARTLFLISGPTGAGKTSILDGICFALYGEATGQDRTPEGLRSDHAAPEVPTRVVFDFELKGAHYRIERGPKQPRPKLRGSGFTTAAADATLWHCTNPADSAHPGPVLATSYLGVTAEVEKLLHFEVAQFRQVVILPQGEFRRFLASKTANREAILATLFNTDRYLHVEKALRERKLAIDNSLHDNDNARLTLLKDHGVDKDAAFEALHQAQALELTQLDATTQPLQAAATAADGALATGRDHAQKLAEHGEARAQATTLEGQRPGIDAQRVELERARQAASLRDTEAHRQRRAHELTDAQTEHGNAQALVQRATEALAQAQAQLEDQLAPKQAEARKAAQARVLELEALEAVAGELEAARVAQALADTGQQSAAKALAGAQQRRDHLQAQLDQRRKAFQQAEAAAEGVSTSQVAANAATATVRHHKALQRHRAEHTQQQLGLAQAQARLEAAQAQLEASRAAQQALLLAQLEGQAALLAGQLEAGAPCPVCGSQHHPAPAQPGSDIPSEAQLAAAQQQLDRSSNQREAAVATVAKASAGLEVLAGKIELHVEQLAEAADQPLVQLEADMAKAIARLAHARNASQQLPALQAAVASLQQQQLQATADHEQAQQAHLQAQQALAAAKATFTERQAKLPEPLRASGALAAASQKAQAHALALQQALEQAQAAASTVQARLAQRKGQLSQAAEALAEAVERDATAAGELAARICEAGFVDPADYAQAKRPAPAMAQLEAGIRAWEQALAANTTRLERAEQAAQGLTAPDLEALEQRAVQARLAHDQHLQQLGGARQRVHKLETTRQAIARIDAEQATKRKQLTIVGRLANVANGRNPKGLAFRRFVLASLLERVLVSANARLQVMSSSRYTLRRFEGRGDGRQAGGLDLEVLDAYTGRARPVSTLSGGEGFEASLALALGLADTVQSRSGGIQLDAVFVDEGFGSLGQEDLDAVLQSLQDLQVGGRLVGIISHVAELRERITTRLELSKARQGSTAHFVVP